MGVIASENSEERHYASELLRIEGRLIEIEGDPPRATDAYRQAIEIAKTQGATLFALRAASDLVQLEQGRDVRSATHTVLETI